MVFWEQAGDTAFWYRNAYRWQKITSGGGGISPSDTAAMLAPYLRYVYRVEGIDSIYFVTGAGNILAVKDSTGSTIDPNDYILNQSTYQTSAQYNIMTGTLDTTKARTSNGYIVTNNVGTEIVRYGTGGSGGALFTGLGTFNGGITVVGTTTLSASLTGILKAASGVVGVAVSGTDLKTINGTSIIGSGDISVGTGTVTGTGAANKVAYWTGTGTLSSNTNFHWDNTNTRLGIGTASPSAPIGLSMSNNTELNLIHGTNTNSGTAARAALILFNNTGATAGFGVYSSGHGETSYRNNAVFGGSNSLILAASTSGPTGGSNFIELKPGGYDSTESRFRAYRVGFILSDATVSGAPATSSLMDLRSTAKGLLIPRMTAAQRTAISSPANGLIVYDTDSLRVMQYNGSVWKGYKFTNESGATGTVTSITLGTGLSGTSPITATGTINVSLDTAQQWLAGDVTFSSADTWTTIDSIDLDAGTWYLAGQMSTANSASAPSTVFLRIIASGGTEVVSGRGTGVNTGSRGTQMKINEFVSPGSTTRYYLQGGASSITTVSAIASFTFNAISSTKVTGMTAFRIK